MTVTPQMLAHARDQIDAYRQRRAHESYVERTLSRLRLLPASVRRASKSSTVPPGSLFVLDVEWPGSSETERHVRLVLVGEGPKTEKTL